MKIKVKVKPCIFKQWTHPDYEYSPTSPKADIIKEQRRTEWMDAEVYNHFYVSLCGYNCWNKEFFIIKEIKS